MAALPVDVLRLVLRAVLGEERQDAYALLRPLSSFALVCRLWRDAGATTPLRINLDYMQHLPTAAVRWLQKMTIADLQVNPGMPINKILTHPDFAHRNRAVLERLWGAAVSVSVPGRGPQFRHFPRLHTLELCCDYTAAVNKNGGEDPEPERFQGRVLSTLTTLRHLSLSHFASANLARLPLSLETLSLNLLAALPLALPEGLHLKELTLACSRLLVDWPRLCSQVEALITIDCPVIEVLAAEGSSPGDLFKQVAAGFIQGCVAEMEIVAQEVALVMLPPDLRGSRHARLISEDDYNPEVVESVHIVTLAADFQTHHFRSLGCIYNPDDIQTDDELGMSDGLTVQLFRYKPDEPQVLGFCYDLNDEQMGYLLSEAHVEGLSLEAVEQADLEAVLNNEDFQTRCAGTLAWLQGVDLDAGLQLGAFPELRRLECYVLPKPESLGAISHLPPGLTSLDLCGVCREEGDVTDRDSWPSFVPGADPQHGWDAHLILAHLGQLKELGLRYFREVDLAELLPDTVEALTLECLRPRSGPVFAPGSGGRAVVHEDIDLFDFKLPPLPSFLERGPAEEQQRDRDTGSASAGSSAAAPARAATAAAGGTTFFDSKRSSPGAGGSGTGVAPGSRSLTIQFHRNQDYPLNRPALFLHQILHAATHLLISVTSDPPAQPAEVEDWEEAADAPKTPMSLVLAAGHGTLREAFDAITDSPLQSIELQADQVLFTDDQFSTFTGSKAVLSFIREHYSHEWLIWAHEMEDADFPDPGDLGGGITMRRKR